MKQSLTQRENYLIELSSEELRAITSSANTLIDLCMTSYKETHDLRIYRMKQLKDKGASKDLIKAVETTFNERTKSLLDAMSVLEMFKELPF